MSEVLRTQPNTSDDELLERQRALERSHQQARINPYLGEVMLLWLGLRNPLVIAGEATSLGINPEQFAGQEMAQAMTIEQLDELKKQKIQELAEDQEYNLSHSA